MVCGSLESNVCRECSAPLRAIHPELSALPGKGDCECPLCLISCVGLGQSRKDSVIKINKNGGQLWCTADECQRMITNSFEPDSL
jgi:hypothetical protein